MDGSLVNVLIQVPLVGAFIWYTLKLNQQNQDAQAKRDSAYLAILAQISSVLAEHDRKFDNAVAIMQERTAAKQQRRRSPVGGQRTANETAT